MAIAKIARGATGQAQFLKREIDGNSADLYYQYARDKEWIIAAHQSEGSRGDSSTPNGWSANGEYVTVPAIPNAFGIYSLHNNITEKVNDNGLNIVEYDIYQFTVVCMTAKVVVTENITIDKGNGQWEHRYQANVTTEGGGDPKTYAWSVPGTITGGGGANETYVSFRVSNTNSSGATGWGTASVTVTDNDLCWAFDETSFAGAGGTGTGGGSGQGGSGYPGSGSPDGSNSGDGSQSGTGFPGVSSSGNNPESGSESGSGSPGGPDPDPDLGSGSGSESGSVGGNSESGFGGSDSGSTSGPTGNPDSGDNNSGSGSPSASDSGDNPPGNSGSGSDSGSDSGIHPPGESGSNSSSDSGGGSPGSDSASGSGYVSDSGNPPGESGSGSGSDSGSKSGSGSPPSGGSGPSSESGSGNESGSGSGHDCQLTTKIAIYPTASENTGNGDRKHSFRAVASNQDGTEPFTYQWSVPGPIQSGQGTDTIYFYITEPKDGTGNGPYTVSVEVTDTDDCTATDSKDINLGGGSGSGSGSGSDSGSECDLTTEVTVDSTSSQQLPDGRWKHHYTAHADNQGGTAPFTYVWEIPGVGNGSNTEGSSKSFSVINDSGDGQTKWGTASVTVTDAEGCTATAASDIALVGSSGDGIEDWEEGEQEVGEKELCRCPHDDQSPPTPF